MRLHSIIDCFDFLLCRPKGSPTPQVLYVLSHHTSALNISDKSESELESVSLLSIRAWRKKNFDCANNIKDLFVCFLKNNRLCLFLARETQKKGTFGTPK